MEPKLQQHFAALNNSFGISTINQLKSLGQADTAGNLQTSVAACIQQDYQACLAPAEAVVQATWKVLQQTGWDHPAWREAYALGQLCLAAAYTGLVPCSSADTKAALKSTMLPKGAHNAELASEDCNGDAEKQSTADRSSQATAAVSVEDFVAKAMQALDLASILGAPPELLAPVLDTTEPLARQAHQRKPAQQPNNKPHSTEQAASAQPADQPKGNGNACQQHAACQQAKEEAWYGREDDMGCIPSSMPDNLPKLDPDRVISRRSAHSLTAAEFRKLYWKSDTPVIITGAMASWKAMHKWPSLKWWSYNHGHRTIPVELGTDSTNTWSETTMLLHTFMTDYMQPSLNQGTDAEVAYIAQHPLFDQMPSLVHDFEQPDLMGGEAMLMNAWIGTKGTVTPLHFDSYDNFLAQVAGFKFLRLYSRQQTPRLYVEHGQSTQSAVNATRAQKNVSAVNIEHPDLAKHPRFAEAWYLECILCPGEMLFIPAKYWHYVRSLSPAVSINFWH